MSFPIEQFKSVLSPLDFEAVFLKAVVEDAIGLSGDKGLHMRGCLCCLLLPSVLLRIFRVPLAGPVLAEKVSFVDINALTKSASGSLLESLPVVTSHEFSVGVLGSKELQSGCNVVLFKLRLTKL